MNRTPPTAWVKLHRATCLTALVAKTLLDDDQVLPGVTMEVAETLIFEAMKELFPEWSQ